VVLPRGPAGAGADQPQSLSVTGTLATDFAIAEYALLAQLMPVSPNVGLIVLVAAVAVIAGGYWLGQYGGTRLVRRCGADLRMRIVNSVWWS
jgi:hypothetical protein